MSASLGDCVNRIRRRGGAADTGRLARDHWLCRGFAVALLATGIFVAYELTYTFAGLFEVQTDVSAFFVPAALTVVVAMLLGLRWLPLVYVILLSVGAVDGLANVPASDFLEWLRHIVVYGLAGLYLRRFSPRPLRQFTLATAIQLTGVAFVASLASAVLTLVTRQYGSPFDPAAGSVFLSFWGGDFAGLMIGVPLILLLHGLLLGLWHGQRAQIRTVLANVPLVPLTLHGLFAAALAVFAAWVPVALGVNTPVTILIVIPVMLAGLLHGALMGFTVTGIASVTYLLTGTGLGGHIGEPIEIQLVLALAAALALLAGAARDDLRREWQLANFDSLTGLPNRRMLMDRIEQALRRARRQGDRVAILFMDLDHFKAVNDTHGHNAGDQLLVEAARRIRACVRGSDTVARLSGDEFVAVVSDVDERSGVNRVAEAILSAMDAPFPVGGHSVRVSASIGIAIFPDDGDASDTLLRHADTALYRAKSEGRNRFRHHAPEP